GVSIHVVHTARRVQPWPPPCVSGRTKRLHDTCRRSGDDPPMPRRRSPPRLYLDKARGQWLIKDGGARIRLGCTEAERGRAEKLLANYLGEKHRPTAGPDPLIADILL